MKTLIYAALILSIWHFVYEGIVAPAIRLGLRNRLFAIRDELRLAQFEVLSKSDERAFSFVHNGINNFLNRLPNMTLTAVSGVRKEIAGNASFRQSLNDHVNAVMNADNQRIRNAFMQANTVMELAFLTNMGGWFIYIVPAAMIIGGLKRLSKLTSEIFMAPAREVDRLFPKAC